MIPATVNKLAFFNLGLNKTKRLNKSESEPPIPVIEGSKEHEATFEIENSKQMQSKRTKKSQFFPYNNNKIH